MNISYLLNPLTGEYFWAQQLTSFKWSQWDYTYEKFLATTIAGKLTSSRIF